SCAWPTKSAENPGFPTPKARKPASPCAGPPTSTKPKRSSPTKPKSRSSVAPARPRPPSAKAATRPGSNPTFDRGISTAGPYLTMVLRYEIIADTLRCSKMGLKGFDETHSDGPEERRRGRPQREHAMQVKSEATIYDDNS